MQKPFLKVFIFSVYYVSDTVLDRGDRFVNTMTKLLGPMQHLDVFQKANKQTSNKKHRTPMFVFLIISLKMFCFSKGRTFLL